MITFTLVDELSEVIHKHKTNAIQQMYVNDYSIYIYRMYIMCSYNIIQYSFHKTMFHQSLRSSCRIYLLPSGRGSRSLRSNAPPAVRRTGIMVHERQPQRDPDWDPGDSWGSPGSRIKMDLWGHTNRGETNPASQSRPANVS
jgi:hypothetical protein